MCCRDPAWAWLIRWKFCQLCNYQRVFCRDAQSHHPSQQMPLQLHNSVLRGPKTPLPPPLPEKKKNIIAYQVSLFYKHLPFHSHHQLYMQNIKKREKKSINNQIQKWDPQWASFWSLTNTYQNRGGSSIDLHHHLSHQEINHRCIDTRIEVMCLTNLHQFLFHHLQWYTPLILM